MKKTLAAVAVLGAFAGSALAADVQLYGLIDTGVRYLHSDMDLPNDMDLPIKYATDKFSMESGMQSGSRWGIKGTEELGNGLTVGFVLEDGFSSDSGAEKGVMFDRESSLFIEGGFGKLALGRIGSINGGVSSWAKHGMMSAFGTSWGSYSAQADVVFGGAGQWDNMIAYQTPTFAGFTVYAQYGMGSQLKDFDGDLTGAENESSSDRYYALGATYANGPLNLYFAVDSINYATSGDSFSAAVNKVVDADDSLSIRFGGNYDFEVAKLFAGVAYFDEARLSSFSGASTDLVNSIYIDLPSGVGDLIKIKGWSLGVSGSIPVAGGDVLVGAGYMDAEVADSMHEFEIPDVDLTRWIVSAGYSYPFSKRTNVYGVVTYTQDKIDLNTAGIPDVEPNVFGAMIGLRHQF